MASIEIERIESWSDLTTKIDEYFTHFNDYIFRGQADAAWRLEPTLTRAIRRTYSDDPATVKNWREILSKFRANLRGRCEIDLSKACDDELWTLGQHYGLHTPMLDWTRSPYVALFFALIGSSPSGSRTLWALLEPDTDKLYASDPSVPNEERIYVVEPMTHENPRLVSQRGLFLRIPPTQSLEDRIAAVRIDDHAVMYKFIFPDSFRDDALAALDRRNINFASLFPDVGGSALHANYEFDSAKHLESMRAKGWNAR